ncbi:hypothetical protein COV06_00455 [Candidatus Uhrbacteria bacterium CG10_big_fil_rev_8_21_14_0_10_50_16]|uniref:Blue (type 1) copper domain-containing protein n=1 Tax=Candidatus Uhrbacteria bacterium CG10_big_fil_rev_8_21_14_0_10_50_16 TaxID=1975039 RepID=A0A2H0RN08_9BACT|nr:MAG: hypothetical protein COV06_00455 [Candidatus Uhrbacteria bacterium CG10_big_fil_rev_8_21_14_0_10_50_16]
MKITQRLSLFLLPLLLLGAGCNLTPNADQDDLRGDSQFEDQESVEASDEAEESESVDESENDTEDTDVLKIEDRDDSREPEEDTDDNAQAPEAISFNVDGFLFGYSEKELRVKKGQAVTINFTSSNGLHDIVIDQLHVASDRINTGEKTSVTFLADQVGSFEYYCTVGSHRANGMVGTLIVE